MAVCYDNKLVLAPMVRVGTLPFRLLAASYGAEIVYTEEIVDLKLVKTERRVDPIKGIVEYVVRQENNNGLEATVFSTLAVPGRAREGAHVILQLGTGGAESALAAARHVEADVDGIDVNMGCPKRFSTQGGMGSALLTEPHKVHAILTTLVKNIKKPVSCKIRILEEDEPTVALLRLIAATGVSAIGIHPRVPNARTDKVPANYVRLANILRAAGDLRVPIILSGDVFERAQLETARATIGVSSVMFARSAMWNASVFAETPVHKLQAAQQFLWYALYYGNSFSNTKYLLSRSFQDEGRKWLAFTARLQSAKTMAGLCEALNMPYRPHHCSTRPPPGPDIGWLGVGPAPSSLADVPPVAAIPSLPPDDPDADLGDETGDTPGLDAPAPGSPQGPHNAQDCPTKRRRVTTPPPAPHAEGTEHTPTALLA